MEKSDTKASRFRYRVLDPSGRRRGGTMEAADPSAARARLRAQGFYVVELAPAPNGRRLLPSQAGRPLKSRRLAGRLYDLSRELAILLRAGVPLARALQTLAPEVRESHLKEAVGEIARGLAEGRSFAACLEAHPHFFDPVYRALVRAGEATGTLDQALARLSGYLAKRLELRDKITSALTYPALVAAVGIVVVVFLVSYVVPRVLGVLETMGRPLPLPTQVLLAVSHAVSVYWPAGLALVAAVVIGVRLLARQENLRRRWDRWMLKAPLYGALLTKQLVARLGEMMATLLTAGVPMGQALALAHQATTNRALAELLEEARRQVEAGRSLAAGLDHDSILPASVVQMLLVGQESGELAEIFTQIAGDYQREVDVAAARFTAILEPLLIVCLAVVVGFIVLATLLPILELTTQLETWKGGVS